MATTVTSFHILASALSSRSSTAEECEEKGNSCGGVHSHYTLWLSTVRHGITTPATKGIQYAYVYVSLCMPMYVYILWGDMAQKLVWISEKGPLSGAARSHANLLRSGSVPPLQRFCLEAVLRASWEVCGVHLLPCIPSARFGIYCSIRPKR